MPMNASTARPSEPRMSPVTVLDAADAGEATATRPARRAIPDRAAKRRRIQRVSYADRVRLTFSGKINGIGRGTRVPRTALLLPLIKKASAAGEGREHVDERVRLQDDHRMVAATHRVSVHHERAPPQD